MYATAAFFHLARAELCVIDNSGYRSHECQHEEPVCGTDEAFIVCTRRQSFQQVGCLCHSDVKVSAVECNSAG